MKVKKHFLGWQKRSASERVLYCIIFAIFALVAFFVSVLPVVVLYVGNENARRYSRQPVRAPDQMAFRQYSQDDGNVENQRHGLLGECFFNSVYFSVIGAFFSASCTAMLAYVTCKYKFPGSGAYFIASLITMILPIYGTGGSMYLLLDKLGLLNSRLMIITSFSGIGVYYMYFYAFFQNVSNTYAEAARIDGAGDYTIFFRVMFPQAFPMFGAIFLMIWMAEWNNYSTALLYLNELPTLSVGIYLFRTESGGDFDILYMAYFITCIPPLVIFAFFNNVLMSNVSLGGIKE